MSGIKYNEIQINELKANKYDTKSQNIIQLIME